MSTRDDIIALGLQVGMVKAAEGLLEKQALAGGDDVLGALVGLHYAKMQKERGERYRFGGKQVASLLLPGGVGYQIGRGIGHGIDPPKSKSKKD